VPDTLIATRAGWVTDPTALIDAVHPALREALKIPEADRTLRLIEHPASHFAIPPHEIGPESARRQAAVPAIRQEKADVHPRSDRAQTSACTNSEGRWPAQPRLRQPRCTSSRQ
jgi:hypothetical protein